MIKENCDHRDNVLGKHSKRENNPNAKLNVKNVQNIRETIPKANS